MILSQAVSGLVLGGLYVLIAIGLSIIFGLLGWWKNIVEAIEILDIHINLAGYVVIGVVLIRHLHLTRALIGLIIGITWIVQGLTSLISGISGGAREGRGWWIAFGLISLIAGIVVASAPASSLNFFAVLFGIWFIIMGVFEIAGGFMLRRALGPAAKGSAPGGARA